MPSSQRIILLMRTAISTGHSPISFPAFTLPLSSETGRTLGTSLGIAMDALLTAEKFAQSIEGSRWRVRVLGSDRLILRFLK